MYETPSWLKGFKLQLQFEICEWECNDIFMQLLIIMIDLQFGQHYT